MIGIKENGIIYGGMVRDEIISTYYKTIFIEYNKSKSEDLYNRFWDNTYHNESSKRTLIPNDIDIYFQSNNNAVEFIRKIELYSSMNNGRTKIINIRNSNLIYSFGERFIHQKLKINFKIGRTIIYSGINININIDIVVNNSDVFSEPPFHNADFTSNIFIMEKSHNDNYAIRLSRHTGTALDTMDYVNKKRMEYKIINDMIEGRTEFIRKSDSPFSEYVNGMRILKMLNNKLKITNLLFNEVDETDIIQNCDICLENINKTSTNIIEIKTNKHAINVMHKSCFIQYLEIEVSKQYRNTDTNEVECRCTRRNLFNFKNSYNYSSLYLLNN